MDQQRCHGAAALVQPGLDDSALTGPVGVGLELFHLGGEGHHLQQVFNADMLLGGDLAADGLAAPLFGHQAVFRQLLHDTVGVGVLPVNFVDGHNDGDLCGLGMVDGFDGLGHDAVIRRHHQNGNIRNHGAAGTINGSNYFKLRDLAKALDGLNTNFEVKWNAAQQRIDLTSKTAYTAVGGEQAALPPAIKAASLTNASVYLDGKPLSLTAYSIGGNNYFKLRDLGDALGFGVDWNADTMTMILTVK